MNTFKFIKFKFFTLIELIVVIVVLGILTAIVIPNISSLQDEAEETAIHSDIRSIQTGIDLHSLDNFNNIPLLSNPTPEKPALVDMKKLKPEYLRNLPKNKDLKVWIDFKGKIWASTSDSPSDVKVEMGKVSFMSTNEGDTFNVYIVNNESIVSSRADRDNHLTFLSEIKGKGKLEVSNPLIKEDSVVVVSSVDIYGLETAPAGKGYVPVENGKGNEIIVEPFTPVTVGTPLIVLKSPSYVEYLKSVSSINNEMKLDYKSGTNKNFISYIENQNSFSEPKPSFSTMSNYDFDHKETENYFWQLSLTFRGSNSQDLRITAVNKETGESFHENIVWYSSDNVHISKYRNFTLAVNNNEDEVAIVHGDSYRNAYIKIYDVVNKDFILDYSHQFRIKRDNDPGNAYYDENGDLYAFAIGNDYLYPSILQGLKRSVDTETVTIKNLTNPSISSGRKQFSITEDLNGKLWVFYEKSGNTSKAIDYVVVNKDFTLHQNVSTLVSHSTKKILQPASFLNKDGSIDIFYLSDGNIEKITVGK